MPSTLRPSHLHHYFDDNLYLTTPDGNSLGHDFGMVKAKVFQQSVTLTAKLWPQEKNMTTGSAGPRWSWTQLRVPSDQLPLVIAVFSGGALIILLILAAILWRCCVAPHRNKDYRVKMKDSNTLREKTVVPVLPSHSAVFLDPKNGGWSVSSRIVGSRSQPGCPQGGGGNHWFYNNSILNPAALDRYSVPRSVSVPNHSPVEAKRPSRPLSQPSSVSPLPCHHPYEGPCSLPQISEFSPHPSPLCASSSVLDECSGKDMYILPSGGAMFKTQSLPACVRNKNKTTSTSDDDPSELYAKVNFSKKRKNRMRNDEAAIIALSKSRSQFLHKDTDTLVDNEAVVVYDERTAL